MTSSNAVVGADIITGAITSAERQLVALSEEVGRGLEFDLDPACRKAKESMDAAAKGLATDTGGVLLSVVSLWMPSQIVSLSKEKGHWALRYKCYEKRLSQVPKSTVLLRDAPLDVRRSFLAQMEAFVTEYSAIVAARRKQAAATRAATDKARDEAQCLADSALEALATLS